MDSSWHKQSLIGTFNELYVDMEIPFGMIYVSADVYLAELPTVQNLKRRGECEEGRFHFQKIIFFTEVRSIKK